MWGGSGFCLLRPEGRVGAGGEEREPAAVTRPARGAPGHKHLRHLFRQERERKWQWPRTSPFQKWGDASGAFGNADVSRTTKVGWLSSGRREGGPQPSARNREVMKRTCFITQVGLAVRLPHPSQRGAQGMPQRTASPGLLTPKRSFLHLPL